ncbi:MAG TPA: hypothetical protein VHX86_06835 [Tepidisphaeraceae bacterium]|jgi:hypothetical protein|nr:hypothetical protein [Tepidisphaeraceae bacterium]
MCAQTRSVTFAFMVAAALLVAACQSSTPSPRRGAPAGLPVADQTGSFAPTSPDEIVETDPAAMRLQDIGGYLLLYYRDHQAMPPHLDDLRAIPGGADLDFTSPSTGQPFVYYPVGMWAPGQAEKCIVAYDPARTAGGKRWCLFMTLPKAGAALSVDVVALPDQMFLNYQRTAQ